MRLPKLDHGHRWYVRALFTILRIVMRRDPPDVMKTLLYRPAFFGLPFSQFAQDVMRGDSPWTPGERELFAAYTSSLNHCVF